MMPGLLFLRVDADARVGGGHLMRCLALAEAWRDAGGTVAARLRCTAPDLRERLVRAGVTIEPVAEPPGSPADAAATAGQARRAGAEWVIVDGYHFSPEFLATVRDSGIRLLAIDDEFVLTRSQADMLLNPNGYADIGGYGAGPASVLAGRRYALLRREFAAAGPVPGRPPGGGVLVVFGAGDEANVTGACLEWLETFFPRDVPWVIVVGAANPHRPELARRCADLAHTRRVELLVNPPDLPGRMAAAELGISAAGSTAWEFAALGVATALVEVAANQRRVATFLGRSGAALELGPPAQAFTTEGTRRLLELWSQPTRRAALGQAGRTLVDFRGPARVVEALRAHPVELRPATAADCELLWQWANDPVVRQASYRSDPISWADHQNWFAARLAQGPANPLLVATSVESAAAVGVARLDRQGRGAEISFLVAPAERGRGFAARILNAATAWMLDVSDCDEISGWVKAVNVPSLRAFRRAGFCEAAPSAHHGVSSIRFHRPLTPLAA